MPGRPALPSRRAFLAMAIAGASTAVGISTGCGGDPTPPPATLRLDDAALPPGTRLVVTVGSMPVELQRTAGGVVARSLVCTHQGCTVAWEEDRQRYKCPCQDAWFDRDGQPVAGPVSAALPLLPVTVADGIIVVSAPAAGRLTR